VLANSWPRGAAFRHTTACNVISITAEPEVIPRALGLGLGLGKHVLGFDPFRLMCLVLCILH